MTSILILAVLLRLALLTVPPLWYDENFTYILARLPFERMIAATVGDVHPPLWYVIEWAVYRIFPAAPPWVIRVPALLCSVASVWMLDKVLRVMDLPPVVARGALVLMAVLPMQIWYAQEGRMYALLELLVLVGLYAVLTRRLAWLLLAGVAMLYTQNYGAFYLAALGLVALVVHGWRGARGVIAVCAVAGVTWLPWLYVVVNQMREIEGRYWILDASAGGVLIILYKMFFAASAPGWIFFVSYLVTFAALIVGTWRLARAAHPAKLPLLIMAFVPLLIAWIASLVWQPVLLFRALIGISPFLYVLVCWPLGEEK
jgi:uncharacterized membrane protein